MNGAQAPFIKLFICLHGIDFRDGNSMTRPRKRNRSRLSLSDSIGMTRLRESQKKNRDVTKTTLWIPGEKDCYYLMVSKRRSFSEWNSEKVK